MNPQQDLQSNDINDIPDIAPLELPGRNNSPSVEDRLLQIETVLNIS